jgi:trk system potassium uptake protein
VTASRPGGALQHPARVIALAFALAVAVGTVLLSLPVASATGERADVVTALFTATSAVCVTGLVTVDTATFWSGFGEMVIVVLIQAGGLGIMTLATLIVVLLARRMGLRARTAVQAETTAVTATDLRRVVRNVVLFSFTVEPAVAAVLAGRFFFAYVSAARSGVFHAISAFNNAGFSLSPDSLVRFVGDGWVSLTVTVASWAVWAFRCGSSWRGPGGVRGVGRC